MFYAPELAQGFGLSGTLGLGGFSNGEAQKAGFTFPHYNTSRLFIRQTFGFGGEQETIEEDQTHFGGKVDVSRLSFTAGRLFLPDFVDNNLRRRTSHRVFELGDLGSGSVRFSSRSTGLFAELNQKTGLFARAIC